MVGSRPSQKWLIISFFAAIGLFFLYFIFSLVMGTTDKTYDTRLEAARTGPGSYHQNIQVNLIQGQSVTVDRLKMTYRGISSGQLKLDVVLLDLDPQYVYSRSMSVKKAKQGFSVSDYHFIATSVNGNRLRLVWENR